MAEPAINLERARDALWSLDPGVERLQWVRIGCAAKAAGLTFDDFNDWSASGANYGGVDDTRDAWRSFKTDASGVNAGTLFYLAREANWQDPHQKQEQKREDRPPAPIDDWWQRGAPADESHGYIERKRGTPDGLRVVTWDLQGWAAFRGKSLQGWLMVPVLAKSGKLSTIQFIGPNSGEKLNAFGHSLAGTFTVGTLEQDQPAYIVEGIGHAWSANSVTRRAGVVSFGASNIGKAAAAIKDAGAKPVIVADRGKEAEARAHAKQHDCEYVTLPDDLPDGADINDLHLERGDAAVLAVLKRAPVPVVPANDNLPDVHELAPVGHYDWPHLSDKMQPLNTIPNLRKMLQHYGFTVRYDVIRKDLAIRFPGQSGTLDNTRETAVNVVTSLCALNRLPKADAPAFLLNIGDENPVNPVMDFITSRAWDGRSRFGELLDTIKTRAGYERKLLRMLLRRWLVSAVAAAAMPTGFWSKGVLVFQGEQSLGKTAWIRSLLPDTMRDVVKIDALIDPNNKDSVISAVSHWICEIGELDGTLRKADIARLKGFISQDIDQFRRPYARTEGRYQRRTVFYASVNPEKFLIDDTGNVRFWTVPIDELNCEHGIDIQQLWAEVYQWFVDGETWWLTREEERILEGVNEDHRTVDPVEEIIMGAYDLDAVRTRQVTASDVLREVGFDKPTIGQARIAANALKKMFGEPKRSNGKTTFAMPRRRGHFPDQDDQPF